MTVTPSAPRPRGRPKDPQRLERVVAAAGRLFQERGFERTLMDDVAREAGVSKMTVYSHFPNKEALFEAAIERGTMRAMHGELPQLDPRHPREMLTRLGKGFMELVRHEQVARMQVMLFGLCDTQRPLREAFYRQGPQRLCETLSAYFEAANEAGTMRVPHPRIAAEQFTALFVGNSQFRVWLNLQRPTPEEDAALLQANVDLFMRGYAPA